MARMPARLTIGELSRRSGVAASALRFYETVGLVASERTIGNQRRYPRHMLRRVAFIRAAQRVGLSLDEIQAALSSLPDERTPTKADWERVSRVWTDRIDHQIADQAPWVPIYNPHSLVMLSARVGNYQFNPHLSVLIDQLWVR